jgi:ribosomal protein S18 acetylase RimI-like enzyme
MSPPQGMNIDVIDLPAGSMAAWLRKMAAESPSISTITRGVVWPDETELVGRWLGLEARQNHRFVGALATRIYRDGWADIAPPNMVADADPSMGTAMYGHLAEQLARRQVRLATTYLAAQATMFHDCLVAAGFRRAHDLLVLAVSTGPAGTESQSDDWAIVPYQTLVPTVLPSVFSRTMVGSLDFPDTKTDAPVSDVLERFSEVGCDVPPRWYVLEHRGDPAGCLLITACADRKRGELQYLGVVPEYRGMGAGRVLVQYALRVAALLGLQVVIAGVDAENDPAIAIYAAAGFELAARRCVFFRRLMKSDATNRYEP